MKSKVLKIGEKLQFPKDSKIVEDFNMLNKKLNKNVRKG